MESNTNIKKRSRKEMRNETDYSNNNISDVDFENAQFPKELEAAFATAIFELGLKHSSPKLIMPLMPACTALSTEHIKSHLQKYRIHHNRSKDEFLSFYKDFIGDPFHDWETTNIESKKHHLCEESSFQSYFTQVGNEVENNRFSQDVESCKKIKTSSTLDNNASIQELIDQSESLLNEWKQLVCNDILTQNKKVILMLNTMTNENEKQIIKSNESSEFKIKIKTGGCFESNNLN
jgi:SHAQKYF class myb-like DNA-binding protein